MRHLRLIFIFIFLPAFCWAQFVRVPILRKAEPQKKNTSARTETLALELPFWDDFSFNNSPYYPSGNLWQVGQSVWVNDGSGINPPTLNVATFDGLDSLGKPYSVNDVLAKGYADKLVSRPLRMDLVTGTQRDSVYIFFMYQYQGNGEAPDAGDALTLWLKDNANNWTQIWSVTEDVASNSSEFVSVKIPITETQYFSDNFQFRFENFGRLSGPFDGWNLDYVYVSNGRKQYAPIYQDFPDRAITLPITSLFKQYRAIPAKHFLENPTNLLTNPSIKVSNQRQDQAAGQPINYDSHVQIISRANKIITTGKRILLDSAAGFTLARYNLISNMTLATLPDVSGIDPATDSIAIKMEAKINSGDNDIKVGNTKDFDPFVYANVDFRHNDTTRTNFILHKHYAYDDGGGEYGASLTTPGAKILYRYDLMYSQPDTLVAVDIYFTHSGDESAQIIKLLVTDSLSDDDTFSLIQQDVVVTRTEKNKFTRVNLGEAVLVQDHFFIGWKQNTNSIIGVGLDYSSDSGNKMSVNFGNGWEPNTDVHGNLMIRPVFGNGTIGLTTAIVPEKEIHSYPNPNHGIFFLPASSTQLFISDVTGRKISFEQQSNNDSVEIRLATANAGMYVVKYYNEGQWHTEKIMVLP